MGVAGGLDGTVKNLSFLHDMLPEGSTWSVTGIGKAHLPMLFAALAMGADGVRVGLEDNILLSKGLFPQFSVPASKEHSSGRRASRCCNRSSST